MKKTILIYLMSIASLASAADLSMVPQSKKSPLSVVDLRCEYLVDPMGIDIARPRLSWKMQAAPSTHGQGQTAYQIRVAGSKALLETGAADLWDSGRVISDQSVLIPYDGKPLSSNQECFWDVRVWDKHGKPSTWSQPAKWSMGLLHPDDWTAEWIRAPKWLEYTHSDITGPTAENITRAVYRTLDGEAEVDVTETVKSLTGEADTFTVNSRSLRADPARRVVKELVIYYEMDGQQKVLRAQDSEEVLTGGPTVKLSPWMRKTIELAEPAERAQIHVASRGYHELWVNGRKVDEHVLDPAVSVLKKRTLYITYDIAPLLREGSNVIGLWLGRGWKAYGTPGVTDERPLVSLQGTIQTVGSVVPVATDTTWVCRPSSYSTTGPWKWGNHGGEIFDARRVLPTWCSPDEPGTDAALSWEPVEAAPAPSALMDAQLAPRNRIGKRIPAVSCTTDKDGRVVLDFGTNLTGWLRLRMPKMAPGSTVTMEYFDQSALRRDYGQIDQFIAAGGDDEVFQSKFNYRGFRWVRITGLPAEPALSDATGLLIESDLEPVGDFTCSNDLINRIHDFNMWTIRCLNLGGYYVDCPHRERLGYGDGQVAVESAVMNLWMPNFYRKWMRDWADVQGPTGEIPFSTPHSPAKPGSPEFGREGPPGWGGALPAITWRNYLYYRDVGLLEELYVPMRQFMERMESHTKDGLLDVYGDRWQQLGDWVPPGRGMDRRKNWPSARANRLFNNCYYIYLMGLMEKMATAVGRDDDAKQYRDRITALRPLVHAEFYDPDQGIYVIDEQAYQVMPLMTGVVPEALRPKIMKKLEDGILIKNNGHLDTGMLGTYFLLQYLSEIGRDDLLFTIVSQKTYPGWGHMLEQGATTMWEQWNGHMSRIHSCFNSPGGWFFNGLAGIRPDPSEPGFKHIIIKPAFVGDLTWVKSHHDSMYGRIVSNWTREGSRVSMNITIPVGSTASVHIPTHDPMAIEINGVALSKAKHVTLIRMEGETAVLKVNPGQYAFVSHMAR